MTDAANWPKGFMVVQGNRMEDLCDTYVQWLKRYPLGPLETDLILAQSNGIAQWLKQTLAVDEAEGGLGIAAGIDTMLPAQFVWQSYCSVLPGLSKQSVYNKQALTWRIYRLLGEWQLEQLAPMLRAYVKPDSAPLERLQLAQQLADLYDQYQVFRADWLQLWEEGKNALLDHAGQAISMPEKYVWQAQLWRLVCTDIRTHQTPEGWSDANRGELHQRFLQACSVIQTSPAGLPRRVVVFGMSSLPMACLEVLKAIAPFTQVLLFVMNPSEYYWGDMVEGRELLNRHYGRQAKRQDMQHIGANELHLYGNPLLASWGKQGRDFLHQFDAWDEPQSYAQHFSRLPQGKVDLFRSTSAEGASLLRCVQDDILQLRSADERQALADTSADTSLEFISAHNSQREIEILHDRLLDDFASDREGQLQPKDVLIMVPDITAYAPHIEAVFGRYRRQGEGPTDQRYLPYHIADTGDRYANPILGAFETLLSLPTQRMTSVQGLGLLEVEACRQHFGIEEEDLQQLKLWIEGANIRWALSEEHRQDLGLPGQQGHNSWQFGIQRLLLGYATGSAEIWRDIAGLGEVSGLGADLLGRLNAFVNALEYWRQQLVKNNTALAWSEQISDLWQSFFVVNDEQVERLYGRIVGYLQDWQATVAQGQMQDQLFALELVQHALYERLDQPSLSSRFMSGAINFATLMPMRAVPFKQIWLLGMNDGVYPRQRSFNDFDLIGQYYRPGDRSRREDDRYLFLEALLSAREKLVISWQGRSSKDDAEQPPSVLVSQLRDYLAKGWSPELVKQQTTQYPLQPFSHAYFAAASQIYTYAKEWQQATVISPVQQAQSLPTWLPERPLVSKDLVQLLKSPVDALYQQRLQINKPLQANETPQTESFALQGLQNWQLSDTAIGRHFDLQNSPSDIDQMLQQQSEFWQLSGDLLDGTAGQIQAQPQVEALAQLHEQWQTLVQASSAAPSAVVLDRHYGVLDTAGEQQHLAVEIMLPNLAIDYHLQQAQQVLVQASKAKKNNAKQWRNLCQAWVQHLAAHQYCQHSVSTYVLTPEGSFKFKPMDMDMAHRVWDELLSVWLQAMHEPLPIALSTGMAVVNPRSKQGPTAKTLADDHQYHCHYMQRHFPTWEDLDIDQVEALADKLYAHMFCAVEEYK